MKKTHFDWDHYQDWVDCLYGRYDGEDWNTLFVAIHRGSLLPAMHLNNRIEHSEMAIVKYQTYDGNDEHVEWVLKPPCLSNDKYNIAQIVILDDICDTGGTMRKVASFIEDEVLKQPNIVTETMCDKGQGMGYYTVEPDAWVVFPWDK